MGKQVKTPRFYVDMPTFLHATGQLGWDSELGGAELLYMNCANPNVSEGTNDLFKIGNTDNDPKTSIPINFVALLNHNLNTDPNGVTVKSYKGLDENDGENETLNTTTGSSEILNSQGLYNGTSIFEFTEQNDYFRGFVVYSGGDGYAEENPQLGSMVVGKYFDCPNSPDLNLTMSRRFDGIKSQKTIGGKTLSNIYYDGPTEWTMNGPNGTYKYPPFELDTTSTDFDQRVKSGLGRKGLRSWKLSFSYIAESDMWMENEVSNNVIADNVDPDETKPSPMLSDNSFNFVWNCTLGGTLPFIFQPDNSEDGRNPDQFAICTFRENTFSVQQVAFNTYKVSMTIDELA